MGQYYKPVNIDKRQWLSCYDYDNGAKLLEHSYIGNRFAETVMHLLATNWNGDRIVWAGDYADPEGNERGDTLYARMGEPFKITPPASTIAYRYLVNHDRLQVVDLFRLVSDRFNQIIHPLPILTAVGNGRGGGDLHQRDARIGSWARQRLAASNHLPFGYTVVDGVFIE